MSLKWKKKILVIQNQFEYTQKKSYHICNLIFCFSTSIIRVPNSTPIVCGQLAITETNGMFLIDGKYWFYIVLQILKMNRAFCIEEFLNNYMVLCRCEMALKLNLLLKDYVDDRLFGFDVEKWRLFKEIFLKVIFLLNLGFHSIVEVF